MKLRLYSFLLLIAALPAYAQSQADLLWNDATVFRDEWGVPHVFANNPRAMAFAFGQAQAEDHLKDMLFAYRIANGRASEVFGERFMASDDFALKMRHRDLALAAYPTLDQVTKDLCEGFALGVNSWIIDHPDERPDWAEGIAPVDVLAFFHHYLMSMAPVDYEDTYRPAPGTPFANAWALAPSRTKEGQSILVMNPHTDYDGIFQWYEAHLVTHDMNVYGATLFGLPILLMGHNDSLGWALSPNNPDIADTYGVLNELAPKTQNPKSVMLARQPGQSSQRSKFTNESDTKSYFVWTDNGLMEQQTQRYMTHLGPVLAFDQGIPYALRVGGYRDFGGLRQLYDMGGSQNLEQFRSTWERQELPLFHVVYTDRNGNLYYNYNAKVGERSGLTDNRLGKPRLAKTVWEEPVSTRKPGTMWGAAFPPHQLPWLVNPDAGYIQASGTPPWLVTDGLDWNRATWGDWLIRDPDTYRAKRLRQMLGQGQRSFEDNQSIMFDIVVPLAVEVVPYLHGAARAHPQYVRQSHPDLRVALTMLQNWDFLAHPNSEAMTYFHVWWTLFSRNYEGRATASEALHAMLQEDTPDMQRFLLDTAADAARLMRDSFQSIQIPWGEAHVIRRGAREVPMPGAYTGEPVFGMGDTYYENGMWVAKQGPGFAMAVQFGEIPKAVSWVPFGTSENPDSPHYADQLPLMTERRFKHTRYTRSDVEMHAVSARGKTIAFRPANSGTAMLIRAATPVQVNLGLSTSLQLSLPAGLKAFTPLVEPVVTPVDTPIEINMELHVPETLCTMEGLAKLAVYRYQPLTGWLPVQDQQLDPNTRTFYVRAYGRQVYAVLGPQHILDGEVALEQHETFEPDFIHLAQDSPKVTGILPQAELPASLSDTERRRIAMAYPEDLPTAEEESIFLEIEASVVTRTFGGTPLPAVPPGWDLRLMEETQRMQMREAIARNLLPAPMPRNQTLITPHSRSEDNLPSPEGLTMFDSAESGRATFVPREGEPVEIPLRDIPEVTSEDLPVAKPERSLAFAPRTASKTAPRNPDEDLVITGDMITRHREAKATARAENPFRQQNSGVAFESGLPEQFQREREQFEPRKLTLAPDPDLSTKLFFGTELDFALPKFGARFALNLDTKVRAQVALMPRPPEAYPAGLTNFSPIFACMHAPISAKGTVAANIRIAKSVCTEESFEQLKVYAYTPETGWLPADGVKKSATNRSFRFIDIYVRTYVVLGPTRSLLSPPKMVP